MRILQLLEPSGGGSGRHFVDLCRGLAARGHAVEAVYSPLRAEEGFVRELKALPIDRVHAVAMTRAPGPSDLAAFRQIRRILKAGPRFDIIHGHSSKTGALARLRLPGPHVPRVYTPHAFRTMDPTLGSKGRLLFGGIESLLGRGFTDALICVSRDEYDHALALGLPARRLHVIVNGTAAPRPDMAETVRAAFGIPKSALVIGFVGRLSPQKAPERLVTAFTSIAAKRPEAHLLMIGSGELEKPLRAQIAAAGLSGRIHLTAAFTGPQAIPAFDLLAMPSRYEAMSYVMLEAVAAGKPIVTTNVGGATTAVVDGETGLIVANSDDTSPLANALVTATAPDRLAALTAASTARRDLFSLDRMIEETEAVYRAIARG
ncbi:Glycosyltransferase involved in cell wall bisynthesis [Rhizobium sp. RU20A]|uniref:glycosyltransferase n=1 Tax=Rhizobium sp. RU20A TaxID=1907412 RepID=UPI000955B565|nr:glycosyltransferase [Rhizobium sp. RU20A]SIP95660.1 Glycosyltransferase involved in cell wall bisynthesis [Rhizobium sp. RU20A]